MCSVVMRQGEYLLPHTRLSGKHTVGGS
jgi:hypothetical protein